MGWNGKESQPNSLLGLKDLFTEEEVKIAIFECDGNKAPGPDGFLMAVFQSQ